MNQYTFTLTLEPSSNNEPESISINFSAIDRQNAIQKIPLLLIPELDESLLQDNQKVTIELQQI